MSQCNICFVQFYICSSFKMRVLFLFGLCIARQQNALSVIDQIGYDNVFPEFFCFYISVMPSVLNTTDQKKLTMAAEESIKHPLGKLQDAQVHFYTCNNGLSKPNLSLSALFLTSWQVKLIQTNVESDTLQLNKFGFSKLHVSSEVRTQNYFPIRYQQQPRGPSILGMH